jgi:hypothetical protein
MDYTPIRYQQGRNPNDIETIKILNSISIQEMASPHAPKIHLQAKYNSLKELYLERSFDLPEFDELNTLEFAPVLHFLVAFPPKLLFIFQNFASDPTPGAPYSQWHNS